MFKTRNIDWERGKRKDKEWVKDRRREREYRGGEIKKEKEREWLRMWKSREEKRINFKQLAKV